MTRRIPLTGYSPSGASKATFVVGSPTDEAGGNWTSVFRGEFYRQSTAPFSTLPAYTSASPPPGYVLIEATRFQVIEAGALNGTYTVSTPVDGLDYDSNFTAGQTTIKVNENITASFVAGGFITNISTFFLLVAGQSAVVVPPRVEIETLPVPALGRSFSGWAEVFQQNALLGLQNFSGTTAPANPIEGMLWFNPAANTLLVWRGAAWQSPNSALVQQTTAATTWTVNHGLGLATPFLAHATFFVEVSPGVFKPIIPADVTYTSADALTVTFSIAYAGYTLVSR